MRSACRSKTATRCPVMSFAVPYGRATRRRAQTFSIARRKSSCETPKCLDQYFKQLEQNPKQSEQNRLKEARPSIRSPVKCSRSCPKKNRPRSAAGHQNMPFKTSGVMVWQTDVARALGNLTVAFRQELRHLTRCLHCGTTLVPSNYLFMANRPNKRAPTVPEPSPRFAFWTGVAAAIVLAVVMTLDYVNGWVR
jgi:hypothetical protein